MASVSSRMAYVMLASIEDEFRAIVEHYAGEEDAASLLSPELLEIAASRRRRDGATTAIHTVGPLLPYLDFQNSYDLANRMSARLPASLAAGLNDLSLAVRKTVAVRNRVAHNRPLDIDDLPTVIDLTSDLLQIGGWDWQKLRQTRTEIKQDAGFIFRAAANLIVDPDTAVANNLPAPDFDETSLLGRKEERRKILRALQGAWPVISILGDGGIGKTALALQVCYDLVEMPDCAFEAVVWVSAKNAQLTSTEIVRIESAVEDSLGLFASAAAELGGSGASDTAIDELINVLESFPTLLVLDNVETVLDESFPRFLKEIPPGSKVLITSRIGVKTENPFKLSGLSESDAVVLMRSLAKARGFDLSSIATAEDLAKWVIRMGCRPAYIKWFVSGLQAGQLPEKLLDDDGLILDFCMSNVFDYLTQTAKSALRAMLVVPGAHTMAELAFLTDLGSSSIQEVILELTTTNFVTQVRSGASGTALDLSDFARSYLRRTLQIDVSERRALTEKQKQLYALGGGLQAAHDLDPYAVETIDVRGVGDYSAAKLLRDALDLAMRGKVDDGLQLLAEAVELAPGYHEVARVEAYLHEVSTNFPEAFEGYSRAKDLAPNDPYVAYFFGRFLIDSGFDPSQGIRELQRAATLDPESSHLHMSIAMAFLNMSKLREALDAASYAVGAARPGGEDQRNSIYLLWQACALSIRSLSAQTDWGGVAEVVEAALNVSESVQNEVFEIATLDLLLWCEGMLTEAHHEASDEFIAKKISVSLRKLQFRRLSVDSDHSARVVGCVKLLVPERGFGFVRCATEEYFLHANELWTREKFQQLAPGSVLVFTPGKKASSGKPPAESVHWVG
ncbi:hypothetical protein H7I77_21855 [Mycolicibacterium novocastrense]|uniref:AAA ATPase n=1 Tax=Mycolicibacterium novocastrense TaxID=59813 RepID=A0AAW5SPX4_MYCNV|nr:NB-ARC domain-containing protein [Mycolicibacterium novocastrense]MCV7025961.1 hypothetical protein [Mycolicibacterium novocastrense]GAT08442.1 AAA ATPase [Mycolicibacterium novocastrense]